MVYFKFEFGWGRNEKKSSSQVDNSSLRGWEFVNSEVKKVKAQGKYKTASNYLTAARSWSKFLKSEEWSFTEMTADNLVAYQHWLGENNVSLNTISAYMRALRHTKQSTTLLYIKSLESPDLGTANHTLMEELGL